MKRKKSWTEKFQSSRPHEVKPAPMDIAGMKKGEIMLIPSPTIIAKFIEGIPRGRSLDVKTFRRKLARRYKAEVACPITTGILLRIVAEAALEAHEQGKALADITPFWRVMDAESPTAAKLSCGSAFVSKLRRQEGI
ncbi:MAG: hypothetical protein ACKVOI_01915 [Dongiaceae bacterium]